MIVGSPLIISIDFELIREDYLGFIVLELKKSEVYGGLGWWGRLDNLERRPSSGRSSHDSCATAAYVGATRNPRSAVFPSLFFTVLHSYHLT